MNRLVPRTSRLAASLGFLLLVAAALFALAGCVPLPAPAHEVTQISTYPALEKGLYDGDVTYEQLARAGNFGIGTFDGMDGEMVALDGQFYQARTDGSVRVAGSQLETPFATVTYFLSDQRLQPAEPMATYDQLKAYLAEKAQSTNRPYAIRLKATFPTIKIRSIPAQDQPYPPLTDVIAEQVTWERKDIAGTLVGYWFPQYLSTLNAPGYHLHFISDDLKVAGHVLDVSVDAATVDIDYLDRVTLRIPETESYIEADFTTKSQ